MEAKRQYLEFLNLSKNKNNIWLLLTVINTVLLIIVTTSPERFFKTGASQDMNLVANFVAISALIHFILISIFVFSFIKSVWFFLKKHIFHKIFFIFISIVFIVERLYSFFEFLRPCNNGIRLSQIDGTSQINGLSEVICQAFLGFGISMSVISGIIGTIIIFLYSWFIYIKSKNELNNCV